MTFFPANGAKTTLPYASSFSPALLETALNGVSQALEGISTLDAAERLNALSSCPPALRSRLFLSIANCPAEGLSEPVSVLRSWSLGDNFTDVVLSGAVSLMQEALKDPTSLSQQMLAGSLVMADREPERVLEALEVLGIEQRNLFCVNGLNVDPIFDRQQILEVLTTLEGITDGGVRLTTPAGWYVCGQAGYSFSDLSDVYSKIGDPDWKIYHIEGLIYVVRVDALTPDFLRQMDLVSGSGILQEIIPIDEVDSPIGRTRVFSGPQIPWADPGILGDLDLKSIPSASQEKWITHARQEDYSRFDEFPWLQSWLQSQGTLVHWSDLHKLLQEIEIAWTSSYTGEIRATQRQALYDRILGIMGEVACRPVALQDYRNQWTPDSQHILLCEGEIRTSDGLMTSDQLIGILDAQKRELRLQHMYEVSVSDKGLGEASQQHVKNLQDRFPEKGLAIFGEDGSWGRVNVVAEEVTVHVLTPSDSDNLRQHAEAIVDEILGWVAIRKAVGATLTQDDRGRYRQVSNSSAAGKFLGWVINKIWDDFEKSRRGYGIAWVDLQIDAWARQEGPAQRFFKAYSAVLKNTSAELNVEGVRKTVSELVGVLKVSDALLLKYQEEIENRLNKLGFPCLPNPMEGNILAVKAGNEARKIKDSLWKNPTSVKAVEQSLRDAIARETDDLVKRFLEGYLLSLREISEELNPSKKRRPFAAIATQVGISEPVIKRGDDEIVAQLTSHAWAVVESPFSKHRDGTRSQSVLKRIKKEAWKVPLTRVEDVQQRLVALVEKEPDNVLKKYIQAYLASLVNVSVGLNKHGSRKSEAEMEKETQVSSQTLGRYEKSLEVDMKRHNFQAFANPNADRSAAIMAAARLREKMDVLWSPPIASAKVVEERLLAIIEAEPEKEVKEFFEGYLLALRNVSSDLNPNEGVRRSVYRLELECSMSDSTLRSYQQELEDRLNALKLGVIPDPEADRSNAYLAARMAGRIADKIWGAASSIQAVRQLFDDKIDEDSKAIDNEVKRYLKIYVACLDNISGDLNHSGIRQSAEAIAGIMDINGALILRYHRRIEAHLATAGWPLLPDVLEKNGDAISGARKAKDLLIPIFDAVKTLADLEAALKSQLEATKDPEVERFLKMYFRSLKNISTRLNSGNVRLAASALGAEFEMTGQRIKDAQDSLSAVLKRMGESVIPDPQEARSIAVKTAMAKKLR